MAIPCISDGLLQRAQLRVNRLQVDLLVCSCRADIAGDIQVEAILLNLRHLDPASIARLVFTALVCVNDLGDMLRPQLILALAFLVVLSSVNKEHIVGLLAFLQHEDAHRNSCGIEEIRRQADHGIDVAVLEQLGADALLSAATEPGPTESQAQGSWRGHAGAGFVGTALVPWPSPLPMLI